MKKRSLIALLVSHLIAIAVGFALGIYALPILIAPPSPDAATVAMAAKQSLFVGEFSRDRKDSDALHWGEGEIALGSESISFSGKLAPGPDYKLYLSPQFVETEADFNRLKPSMVRVGDIKTFDNFVLTVPAGIDPSKFKAAIIWCETFGQYITSAEYVERSKRP